MALVARHAQAVQAVRHIVREDVQTRVKRVRVVRPLAKVVEVAKTVARQVVKTTAQFGVVRDAAIIVRVVARVGVKLLAKTRVPLNVSTVVHQDAQKVARAVQAVRVVTEVAQGTAMAAVQGHAVVVRVVHRVRVHAIEDVAAVQDVQDALRAVHHVLALVAERVQALATALAQVVHPPAQALVTMLAQRQMKHRLSRTLAVISASEML